MFKKYLKNECDLCHARREKAYNRVVVLQKMQQIYGVNGKLNPVMKLLVEEEGMCGSSEGG